MKGMLFNYELGLFTATIEGRKDETRRLALDGPLSAPKYKVGERVYLKETYDLVIGNTGETEEIIYKSTHPEWTDKWKNKLFMGEKYARYFIEIIDHRVEHLHDITEESCLREGIQPLLMSNMQIITQGQLYRNYLAKKQFFNEGVCAIESYKSLWNKINKKKCPWESNPWVHVYNYKLVK